MSRNLQTQPSELKVESKIEIQPKQLFNLPIDHTISHSLCFISDRYLAISFISVNFLAPASENIFLIYDLHNTKVNPTIIPANIFSMVALPKYRLAFCNSDGLWIWDAKIKGTRLIKRFNPFIPVALAYLSAKNMLVCQIDGYDINGKRATQTISLNGETFEPNLKPLCSGDYQFKLCTWRQNLVTLHLKIVKTIDPLNIYHEITLEEYIGKSDILDDTLIISSAGLENIYVYDLNTRYCFAHYPIPKHNDRDIRKIILLPFDQYATLHDGAIKLWELESGKMICRTTIPDGGGDMAFSSDLKLYYLTSTCKGVGFLDLKVYFENEFKKFRKTFDSLTEAVIDTTKIPKDVSQLIAEYNLGSWATLFHPKKPFNDDVTDQKNVEDTENSPALNVVAAASKKLSPR